MRWSRSLALASLVLASAPAVLAQSPSSTTNVRLNFEIGRLEGGRKVDSKTYELLSPIRGKANLNVTSRMPIPAAMVPGESGGSGGILPTSSFTYQNLGFSANVETEPLEAKKLFLRGRIEWSLLRNEAEARTGKAAAIIGNYAQDTSATLQDGRTARLVTVEEPGSGGFYVEVTPKLVE